MDGQVEINIAGSEGEQCTVYVVGTICITVLKMFCSELSVQVSRRLMICLLKVNHFRWASSTLNSLQNVAKKNATKRQIKVLKYVSINEFFVLFLYSSSANKYSISLRCCMIIFVLCSFHQQAGNIFTAHTINLKVHDAFIELSDVGRRYTSLYVGVLYM